MNNPILALRKYRRARRVERAVTRGVLVVVGVVAAGLAVLAYKELPALRRYIRIRMM